MDIIISQLLEKGSLILPIKSIHAIDVVVSIEIKDHDIVCQIKALSVEMLPYIMRGSVMNKVALLNTFLIFLDNCKVINNEFVDKTLLNYMETRYGCQNCIKLHL